MKFQSIRTAVLSTLVLASPALTLAANQSTGMHVPSQSEMQNRDGVTRAVQQGKGSGMTRSQGVHANAYRSQTAAESRTSSDRSAVGSKPGDTAFRK
jgi:Protein of unknown function (DUF2756)